MSSHCSAPRRLAGCLLFFVCLNRAAGGTDLLFGEGLALPHARARAHRDLKAAGVTGL